MTRAIGACIGTRPEAREAAESVLEAGKSGLEAAIAGYFASAGHLPWALSAPIVVVAGGAGSAGAFCDGRSLQAGEGLEGPIRYRSPSDVPPVATLTIPTGMLALQVALALHGQGSLSALSQHGQRTAKQAEAPLRARLLKELGTGGFRGFLQRWFQDWLAEQAPRMDGAVLTAADWEGLDVPETERPSRPVGEAFSLARPSFGADEGLSGERHCIIAGDRSGGLGAVYFEKPTDVAPLGDGELEWAAHGNALLKGVPKTKAGTRLPFVTPIGLVGRKGHVQGIVSGKQAALSLEQALSIRPDATLGAEEEGSAGQGLVGIWRNQSGGCIASRG